MASGDLRDELNCSICLSLYTDPVSLRCGHNFCRSCIVEVLDTQDGSGGYSCPDCRAEYPEHPALEKNRKLGNIVERFLSTRPDMEETRIFCTYCDSPIPAVRSCLHCENSLCEKHLTAHNKAVDHVLTEPNSSFGNKKCSIHKKVLEYYCPQDAACLCVSCCLVGKHRGHQVELLDEASEKKKEELRKHLDDLNLQKCEIQSRTKNLQDNKRNIQEKASDSRENVSKIFMDIKRQLEMAEKKAQSQISKQEEKIVSQISHQIQKLEIKADELSRKMRHVEEMCQVTDPIRLLQEGDVTVHSHGADEGKLKSEDDPDVGLVSGKGDVHVSDTKVQDDGTDPIPVLQESNQGAAQCDKSMETEGEAPVSDLHDKAKCLDKEVEGLDEEAGDLDDKAKGHDEEVEDLDEFLISLTLHRSMRDIVTSVTSQLRLHVPDILLDEDTANTYVELSKDLKTATRSKEKQDRPKSPGRFLKYAQVLSRCVLSSGRHYWEVEWNKKGRCDIGVSYPSIKRAISKSATGDNDKSWCLILDEEEEYSVIHNGVTETLYSKSKYPVFEVFLDYEAGRLSFYELGDPIRHLHTFTASFTESLHVIFYVFNGASVTLRS